MIIVKNITHFVANEQLRMQNHMLEMLTATISHDMRTPLNAILGVGGNISKYIKDSQGLIFHKIMMNSSKLLLFLVNDLLDLFRIKNGKFLKNEVLSDIRYEISEILEVFRLQSDQKGLKLLFDCEASIPRYLVIDIQRVKQILINLLGNSLKFTMRGSIAVHVDLINSLEESTFLKISVCDTGIGIKQEDRKKIFKPFGKLEDTANINTCGIGLGVSICKQIVEGLGGEIFIEDQCSSMLCSK